MKKPPTVLALDVEGTLISNAVSQIPRPGLYQFLETIADLFPRIVVFTTVEEPLFRRIAATLSDEGSAPPWFVGVEYVWWHGATKNLEFIGDTSTDDVLLVDDFEEYIHPGQEARWVRIDQFCHPYSGNDTALHDVLAVLTSQVGER